MPHQLAPVLQLLLMPNLVEFSSTQVSLQLAAGRDVILYTSRGVPLQGDGAGGLVFGERVGAALVACVAGLTRRPRFLVSKGGITSSDVATRGLGMKRAEVSASAASGLSEKMEGMGSTCCGGCSVLLNYAKGLMLFYMFRAGVDMGSYRCNRN